MPRVTEFSAEVFKCLMTKFRGKELPYETFACSGNNAKFNEDDIEKALREHFNEIRVDFENLDNYQAKDSGLVVVDTLIIKVVADKGRKTVIITMTTVTDHDDNNPKAKMKLVRVY